MKHLRKLSLGFGLLAAVAFTSCSNDEPTMPTNPDQGSVSEAPKDVFASLTLRLPAATTTKAGENDPKGPQGEEFGQGYENSVGRVLVILAVKDSKGYKYLTSAEADAKSAGNEAGTGNYPGSPNPQPVVKYILNFASKEMNPQALADGSGVPGATPVYVFAYCNPSSEFVARIKKGAEDNADYYFADEMASITLDENGNSSIWEENKFLMTNSELVFVKDKETGAVKPIPSKEELVANHNTPEKAFDLGTVKVKRACARFDFAATNADGLGDNIYAIADVAGGTNIGTVELTDMALFNLAKNFYYLPRTNSLWSWTGDTYLCGELEDDYVVSWGRQYKAAASLAAVLDNITPNYFHFLIDNNLVDYKEDATGLIWTSLKNWSGKGEDNDEGWTPGAGTNYRIWRYATENTIPAQSGSVATSSQRIGITTGVVFRGVFTPDESRKDRWNGNAVYVHNDIVFGDYETLKAYVAKYPDTSVADHFKKVAKLNNATDVDLTKSLIKDDADAEKYGFKCYEPVNGKYIMYYFYYNRHNTNGNNSSMGANEFGVVRNNVYKLAVTKISALGDPETPNKPDEPDEKENAYFTVNCVVLPWTVRVNDIEF